MAISKNLIKEIMLAAHPVGCYYISSDATDPAKLFGGTWRRITNRVIYAASDQHPAGSTGGEETVSLTEEQNGKHKHNITYQDNGVTRNGEYVSDWGEHGNFGANIGGKTGNYIFAVGSQKYSGEGSPHENMMPYIAAYMWQRTA